METIDDEVTEHALNFIDKAHNEGKPFFLWYNTTGHALPDALRRESTGERAKARGTTTM